MMMRLLLNLLCWILLAAGALLLAAAFPIAREWSPSHTLLTYRLCGTLWLATAALAVFYAGRCGASVPMLCRYLLIYALFTACVFSVVPSREYTILLALETQSLTGIALLGLALIAYPAAHSWLERLGRALGRGMCVLSGRWFIGLLCFIFLAATVSLSWYCFSFIPAYPDAVSQYIQGKIFASGHLSWHETMPQFFSFPMAPHRGENWYAQYEPMHPFMLALGYLAGAAWLVNPVEGVLTLIIIYALARRIEGEVTARLAALLTLFSPFVLFMSISYMNHSTSLLFSALFLWCYVEMLETVERGGASWRWAVAGGLSLGAVILTRPLTALGVAMACILYALLLMARDWRRWWKPFTYMSAAGLLSLLFQGWYNYAQTGDALLFPYLQYSRSNLPGFINHNTPLAGLIKAQGEWALMNGWVFQCMIPGTVFIALACLLPLGRYLKLLLAVLICYTAVNMINRFHNTIFGPRYIYEVLPALLILSAAGLRRLPLLMRGWGLNLTEDAARGLRDALLLLVFAIGWGYHMPMIIRRYANHYFDNHIDYYESLLRQSQKPALIFIERASRLGKHTDRADKHYPWVRFTNPPREDAPVIFAHDLGARDTELMARYPHRYFYRERDGVLYPLTPQTAP